MDTHTDRYFQNVFQDYDNSKLLSAENELLPSIAGKLQVFLKEQYCELEKACHEDNINLYDYSIYTGYMGNILTLFTYTG